MRIAQAAVCGFLLFHFVAIRSAFPTSLSDLLTFVSRTFQGSHFWAWPLRKVCATNEPAGYPIELQICPRWQSFLWSGRMRFGTEISELGSASAVSLYFVKPLQG